MNTKPKTDKIERRLQQMIGSTFIHNSFHKTVTGYELGEKQIKIHTSMRPVYLPLQVTVKRIEQEFLPIR